MKKPWEDAPFGRLPRAFFCQCNGISAIGSIVNQRPRIRFAILAALLTCAALAESQDSQKQKLDRQYQSAVSQYEAGQYAQALSQLEELLPHVPNSFALHELMGLVYASLSQNAKAIEHLQTAVRLQPGSAVARTNLATTLFHAGKASLAGEQFRKALELEPKNFDANHNLGEFYIQSGKIAEACPKLEEAQRIAPSSYDNDYDLALAYFLTGRLAEARKLVQSILPAKNAGELHNLLGQIEEKDGKYIAAANEFETAAHMDPSEDNLFDWGSELLLHRAYEPAIEVFQEATRRYPSSPRLMIGLGMTLDQRGKYDEAIKALLAAADLDPSDARCYLFLSKAYDSSPSQAGEVIKRFQRYAELKPNNALAQYYYALSLWKGKRVGDASLDLQACSWATSTPTSMSMKSQFRSICARWNWTRIFPTRITVWGPTMFTSGKRTVRKRNSRSIRNFVRNTWPKSTRNGRKFSNLFTQRRLPHPYGIDWATASVHAF